MTIVEFTGDIRGGAIIPPLDMRHFLRGQDGQKVRVTLSPNTKKRSLKENRYWYGVIIPHVREMFTEAGNAISADDVHEFIKQHVLASVDTIFMPDGMRRFIVRSSASWTTREFEDNAEKVRAWAAQYGCQIPLPNEQDIA